MVSSMGGYVAGDYEVVDSNATSQAGDVGDNGGMTCGAEVSEGDVEYSGGMKLLWGWCGILKWYGSLINGTTSSTTTRSTTPSPSPSTSDRLYPNCSG